MQLPTLRHVYGSLAELNDTLVSGGAANLTDASNNARKLQMLDEVSRLIDAKAHRGSGFGPWVGTRKYDGDRCSTLYLRADLSELTSLSIAPSQGVTPVEPTVDTDFLLTGLDGYDEPIRKIILHRKGAPIHFGTAIRGVVVEGVWSYPYRTVVLAATLTDSVESDDTDVPVDDITEMSPGITILVDDEQMYVSAVTPAVDMADPFLTVERGVNGTTAIGHEDESAIARYMYDPSVHTCALALAERRWKARDAGADGTDGSGDLGITIPRKSEGTLIKEMLRPVMLVGDV